MRELTVIYMKDEHCGRRERMEDVLTHAAAAVRADGAEVSVIESVAEIEAADLRGRRVIFAVPLSEAGVNMEYYRMLEYFRIEPHCLDGCTGGIMVDGNSELFTKALARRLAFSADMAGCTFPGKPLVEATGSLANFHVMSKITGLERYEVYKMQAENLFKKVLEFEYPAIGTDPEDPVDHPLRVLAVHASMRSTSNTLLLWDMVKKELAARDDVDDEIKEVSLRNGSVVDCRGCRYEDCLHFGENDGCFYGGIMVEQVYPAILNCDVLVMICPNYNDAVGANLTAFINRLTALFRSHDFTKKRIYALVISGYSGSDIVSEQLIGAINFNKEFILPPRFALLETANDPKSVLEIDEIEKAAAEFAAGIH